MAAHPPHIGELAFYRCWSPRPGPLHILVTVAGSRWNIEELFQTGKGQVGLDHYQVRSWTGWHRSMTVAMLALAVLTILAAQQPDTDPKIVALTIAETRRFLNAFILATSLLPEHTLPWSIWRRTSQARARRSHNPGWNSSVDRCRDGASRTFTWPAGTG
ncbi:hypothetical protein [Micromonospora sp. WMMD964]|uniref:hypothetical protein n=1 Tax=Micromonospora sp. WMMD964 TaxID=3016091 RepID=UPI00249AB900|nr:hypothetical protein [Micromonospora sp. WMMD964]WFF02975.1 hypothetical protein O7616_09585 [Micromonospora sp. WMMD964]